jgi:hypothetical protein
LRESKQRQKPSIYKRRVNRDRNPTFAEQRKKPSIYKRRANRDRNIAFGDFQDENDEK